MEKTLRIPNMSCKHCVMRIEQNLSNLEGVASVDVNLEDKSVKVEWEDATDLDAIKVKLQEIGYPANAEE
jgi:copper ion binding protein